MPTGRFREQFRRFIASEILAASIASGPPKDLSRLEMPKYPIQTRPPKMPSESTRAASTESATLVRIAEYVFDEKYSNQNKFN
ncbi:hypothetical protein TWF788_009345 [Orbilia oligospora]|uniref:Uncharacterized protein n=1 Tax=Orbilia oligospora TaxID=2813651 RepID=A0A7C8PLT4_ORBOL|nr:hypothetical protein TWF788_009345 [Orbilia oligospora]